MDPSRHIYKENKIGPKIDPWGRPYFKWTTEDEVFTKLTEKFYPVSMNKTHFRAAP